MHRFGFAHLGANQKLRKKVRFRGVFGYGNAVSFFSKRCMSAKKSDIACFVEVPARQLQDHLRCVFLASVSLGGGATICAARSRCHLWKRLCRHDPRYGDGGSPHRAAIPVAKSVFGTTRGLHPTRVDQVIVWNERSLRRTLQSYFAYYHRSRTHLSLGKDSPEQTPASPSFLHQTQAGSQNA